MTASREWSPSPFAPDWQRAGLFNDKKPRSPGEGAYTTMVRRIGAGQVALPPFSFAWEVLLLHGDLDINGTKLAPGDHCAVKPGEVLNLRTTSGCEYLVIAR